MEVIHNGFHQFQKIDNKHALNYTRTLAFPFVAPKDLASDELDTVLNFFRFVIY